MFGFKKTTWVKAIICAVVVIFSANGIVYPSALRIPLNAENRAKDLIKNIDKQKDEISLLLNRLDKNNVAIALVKGGLKPEICDQLFEFLRKGFDLNVVNEKDSLTLKEVLTFWGSTGIDRSMDAMEKLSREGKLKGVNVKEGRRYIENKDGDGFAKWFRDVIEKNPAQKDNFDLRIFNLANEYLQGGTKRLFLGLKRGMTVEDLAKIYDPTGKGRNILKIIYKDQYEKIVPVDSDDKVIEALKKCKFQDIVKGIIGATNIFKSYEGSVRHFLSGIIGRDEKLIDLIRNNGFSSLEEVGFICNGMHISSSDERLAELRLFINLEKQELSAVLRQAERDRIVEDLRKKLGPMPMFGNVVGQIKDAADAMDLHPEILKRQIDPEYFREVKMDMFFVLDKNGNLAEDVSPSADLMKELEKVTPHILDEDRALASWMTLKNAVAGIPYGGGKGCVAIYKKDDRVYCVGFRIITNASRGAGKGGIRFEIVSNNKEEFDDKMFANIIRGYVRQAYNQNKYLFGPYVDVPAPDMNTNPKIMAWFLDEHIKLKTRLRLLEKTFLDGLSPLLEKDFGATETPFYDRYVELGGTEELGTITGKPVEKEIGSGEAKKIVKVGGSEGRAAATGQGVVYAAIDVLKEFGDKLGIGTELKGKTVAIQAIGNVGGAAARIFYKKGAKVVAVSDFPGLIYDPEGIDVPGLFRRIDEKVKAMEEKGMEKKGLREKAMKEVFEETKGFQGEDRDKKILKMKVNIVVAPDIWVNIGGVVFSYYEWLQNLKGEHWHEVAGNKMLEQRMAVAYQDVSDRAKKYNVSLRKAATILALEKVASAMVAGDENLRMEVEKTGLPYREYDVIKYGETQEEHNLILKKKLYQPYVNKCEIKVDEDLDVAAKEILEKILEGRRFIPVDGPAGVGKLYFVKKMREKIMKANSNIRTIQLDLDRLDDEQRLKSTIDSLDKDVVVFGMGDFAFSDRILSCFDPEKTFKYFVNMAPGFKLPGNKPFTSSDDRLIRLILEEIDHDVKNDPAKVILKVVKKWPALRERQINEIYTLWEKADRTFNASVEHELLFFKIWLEKDLKKALKIAEDKKTRKMIEDLLGLFKGFPDGISGEELMLPSTSMLNQFAPRVTTFYGNKMSFYYEEKARAEEEKSKQQVKEDFYVLTMNLGSSSLKFSLINMKDESLVKDGKIEIDKKGFSYKFSTTGANGEVVVNKVRIDTEENEDVYKKAIEYVLTKIIGNDARRIVSVGHRVVHGGEKFKDSILIDESVKEEIRKDIEIAPLHNPPNLKGIEACEELLPGVPQIAVFDTAFHNTIEPEDFLYALPNEFYTKYGIRKYGFHGTSYKYITEEAAKRMRISKDEINLIICHLGNGSSVCGIKNGKSVMTSMGFTPLQGLPMGTRSGDIDPATIEYLMKEINKTRPAGEQVTIKEITAMLNKESGLAGLSGVSNDFRALKTYLGIGKVSNLEEAEDAMRKIEYFAAQDDDLGKKWSALALKVFASRIADYISQYYGRIGGIDAIVFTAGIGENELLIREMVAERLPGISNVRDLIQAIPTNEELKIARDVYGIVSQISLSRTSI